MNRRLVLAAFLSLAVTTPPGAQEALHAAADRARIKIDSIIANGEDARDARAAAARTTLTEAEINAYLLVDGPEVLPNGITEPRVRLGDDGRIRAQAVVDLDAVRRARPRGWRDPLSYVTGSVEVVAAGRIASGNGIARAQLDSATVAGVSVPQSVVQEMLRFFTATPDRPEGLDLDDAFVLPADIRRVVVRRGHAVVVQ